MKWCNNIDNVVSGNLTVESSLSISFLSENQEAILLDNYELINKTIKH